MSEEKTEEVVKPGQKSKSQQAFEEMIAKLTAVMGGEGDNPVLNPTKAKVPNDVVGLAVERVLEKRRKDAVEKFEGDLVNFLEKAAKYVADVAEARKTFEKAVEEKQKALTQEGNNLFSGLQSIDQIKVAYINALRQAGGDSPVTEPS